MNPIGGISVCQGERCRLWVDAGAAGTVAGGDRAGRRGRAPSRARPARTAHRESRTAAQGDSYSDSCDVLADPERLAAEHQNYRAIVGRDYGAARDRGPRQSRNCGTYGRRSRRNTATRNGRSRPATRRRRLARPGWPEARRRAEPGDRPGYARIREAGERTIIPGILSAEAEDPTRCLAGFDKRFKGEDRLKENAADRSSAVGTRQRSTDAVSDAVHLTYRYRETATPKLSCHDFDDSGSRV